MKNRTRMIENEVKALLTRLKHSQAEYPADLLANRRLIFLGKVPPAGIFVGNKAVFTCILHGIRMTAGLVTIVFLLTVITMTAVGMVLVGNNLGW